MKYTIVIERSAAGFGTYAPDLPGVGVGGDSIDEVKALLRQAIDLHLDALRADGEPISEPTVQIDYIETPAA